MRPFFNAINTMAMALGLAFIILGISPFIRSEMSDAWHAGHGKILSSELVPGTSLWGWALTHRVHIVYQYETLTGEVLDSAHLEFGIGGHSYLIRGYAERVVERYPVGKLIRAYYDPDQPNVAVLERGPSMGGSIVWIMIGVFSLGASVFVRFPDTSK